jgi:hypothetical protein
MKLLLLITLLLIGCNEVKKIEPPITIVERLREQAQLYKTLNKELQDADGFILTDKCDSLLFSALANPNINLEAAEVEPGKWLRRPTTYPECWAASASASTISRDMLLGVMWRAWKQRNLPLLERLYAYGELHKWDMGQGDSTATFFSPIFVATLAQMIYKLGGTDRAIRNLGWVWNPEELGYKAHIQALHILIRKEAYDKSTNLATSTLERMSTRNPSNAFYLAVLEKYEEAAEVLERTFPKGRLPTKEDWCEEWRWQREETDENLKPCPAQAAQEGSEEIGRGTPHTGGDFLFVYELLGGE